MTRGPEFQVEESAAEARRRAEPVGVLIPAPKLLGRDVEAVGRPFRLQAVPIVDVFEVRPGRSRRERSLAVEHHAADLERRIELESGRAEDLWTYKRLRQ